MFRFEIGHPLRVVVIWAQTEGEKSINCVDPILDTCSDRVDMSHKPEETWELMG